MTPIPCGYLLGGVQCELAEEGRHLVLRPTVLRGMTEQIGERTEGNDLWRIYPTNLAGEVYRYLQPRGRVHYEGRDHLGDPLWRVG